ncbi:MAG TPA: transporter [Geminicoccaceae bacterium]|nr:transporter [Geminicoccus sp.]HMU50972.1 transporter [Geminicoccaceae bacterium]
MRHVVWSCVVVALSSAAWAQDAASPPSSQASTLDLAKKAQNPVANLISMPIQNNLNFGYGAKDAPKPSSTQYVLNIQPVIPLTLGDSGFNLITRPIIPIIRQPDLVEGGDTWGMGDIQVQSYLSPSGSEHLIWGLGGVLQPPTATEGKELGTQKWSAGPAAVVLAMPGKWVFGGLLNQLWSFAGKDDREDVSLTTFQPFVNYNFEEGWYLSASPIITANWEADGNDNKFTVPVGGGGGRLIRIGKLPVNLQAQAFYNAVKPDDPPTADWTLRLQVQFLFPK